MTDRETLLRAICDKPDDDAPRLIYADWLECEAPRELQDSEQAAFIRGEIEWERLECEGSDCGQWGSYCEPCVRRHSLGSCLRKLLAARRISWINGMIGPAWKTAGVSRWIQPAVVVFFQEKGKWRTGPFNVTFSRGFIERIGCTVADCHAHLDTIIQCHPIRKVVLTTKSQHLSEEISPRWPGIEFTSSAAQGTV